MSRVLPFVLGVLSLLALAAPPAAALSQQQYVFDLPRRSEAALVTHLNLSLGTVIVRPAQDDRQLFHALVRVQDARLTPDFEHETDGDEATVTLQLDSDNGFSLRGLRASNATTWEVDLSKRVSLLLNLELGMADADLDLSDLRLEHLDLECGMTKARLRFDRPNPVPMKTLRIETGMSTFEATGLGNARFETFSFEGGAGSFMLDFSGDALRPGSTAHIEVGMAKLQVTLPRTFPVVLHTPDSWFNRISVPEGYTKRGENVWHNELVRRPDEALNLYIEAGIGSIDLQ